MKATRGGTVSTWVVRGSFYARRNYWQPFQKECEAATDAAAREWALSEIGSCHHVKRRGIRIDSIAPPPAA
ncbi:MAG TPA: 50S ribosomal protein L18Ae [Thermoplasmata archaeon]|jgi:ribosomal protein L20A (L18A)|nr:50S ribosomal protein L18Ae [Thermoplasmata archaeon]